MWSWSWSIMTSSSSACQGAVGSEHDLKLHCLLAVRSSSEPRRRGIVKFFGCLWSMCQFISRLGHCVVRLGHYLVRLGHCVVRLGHCLCPIWDTDCVPFGTLLCIRTTAISLSYRQGVTLWCSEIGRRNRKLSPSAQISILNLVDHKGWPKSNTSQTKSSPDVIA